MKFVIIHNSYQQPGGEDVVVSQERNLLERYGHKVVSYLRSNNEIGQMSRSRRLVMIKDIVYSEASKREILDLLRKEQPDLVHVHNTFMMISPSVYEACHEEGVPVLQTLHNYRLLCPAFTFSREGEVCEECVDHGLWRSVLHRCYRDSRLTTAALALTLQVHRARGTWNDRIDGYIALSNFARRKFVEGGLPSSKMHVKPNFVYPDPGARETPGSYALFVGRLSAEKGLRTLLAAWEKLITPIPLVVIGDGPLNGALRTHATARNLHSVEFRGWLSQAETRAAIKQAAFVITPSLWYEGFPMTIAEAFACGTPVLCSKLGGMEEIVVDRRTGIHFIAGSTEDLASKVEEAWRQPSLLTSMGREARHEYESHYTADKNYSLLMDIYHQTMSRSIQNRPAAFRERALPNLERA